LKKSRDLPLFGYVIIINLIADALARSGNFHPLGEHDLGYPSSSLLSGGSGIRVKISSRRSHSTAKANAEAAPEVDVVALQYPLYAHIGARASTQYFVEHPVNGTTDGGNTDAASKRLLPKSLLKDKSTIGRRSQLPLKGVRLRDRRAGLSRLPRTGVRECRMNS